MRIGIYGTRGIPSTYSGYETFLTELLPALAAKGHDITVYCRREVLCQGSDRWRGVRRVSLPSLRNKQLDTLSHGLLASLRARVDNHDVILVVNVANAMFCALGTATRQPQVLNTDGQEWLRSKWGRLAKLTFLANAKLSGRVANLISDSAAMAAIYRHQFGFPSSVIPYAWTSLTAHGGSELLSQWGILPAEYFVAAGRMVPENNLELIAEAFHRSADQSVNLVILGEANYRSPSALRVRELASLDGRIKLLGHITNRDSFATLLQNARAVIHGHSVGGTNPGLIEAMGIGAFILAFDTPFNRETMRGTGRLFAGFGPELTSLIESVPPSTAAERRQASSKARQVYDLDLVADAYDRLLRRVVVERRFRGVQVATRWQEDEL